MTNDENRIAEVCSAHRRILAEILGMLGTEAEWLDSAEQSRRLELINKVRTRTQIALESKSKGIRIECDPSGDDYELVVDGPGGICDFIVVAISGDMINVKWRPWESMDADRPFFSITLADPDSFNKIVKAVINLAAESMKTKSLVDAAFALADLSANMMRDACKMISNETR